MSTRSRANPGSSTPNDPLEPAGLARSIARTGLQSGVAPLAAAGA